MHRHHAEWRRTASPLHFSNAEQAGGLRPRGRMTAAMPFPNLAGKHAQVWEPHFRAEETITGLEAAARCAIEALSGP